MSPIRVPRSGSALQAAPGRWPASSPGDEASTGRFVSVLGPHGGTARRAKGAT